LQIDTFILGDFETNCYVVRSAKESKNCLLIDPGFAPEPLITFLKQEGLQPQIILLTHGHCDHIAGVKDLKKLYNSLKVCVSSIDAEMLTKCSRNLSLLIGTPFKLDPADEFCEPQQIIEFDQIKLEVLSTPGHTPGGVSFYCREEKILFTGDALFAGSIGRTDFPGGNMKDLIKGILTQLLVLPDETRIYSGHGPVSTIGQEKQTNPFIQQR